jgi:nucleoside-diphosphate-sugar epimerase
MDTKTFLVTGAGGYIGKHVVKALLEQDKKVIAVDINTKEIDKNARIVNMDLYSGDKDIYEQLGCPDVCIHLAWKDGFIHNVDSHMKYLYTHYDFLRNMIDGGLKHLAVMGSMHEIGYYVGSVDENTPTRPTSNYGIAKNALRQAVGILADEHHIVIQWLRGFYIYGDDMNNNSIFSKIIESEKNGCKTFPFNSGINKNDFISVHDLSRQIAAVSMQEDITGIINCCSGNPVSLKEIVEEFIQRNNFKIKLDYGAFPERSYDSPAIWGNNEKIKIILNNLSAKGD